MDKKILIVDDRTDTVDLVTFALNKAGYITYSANTGPKALQMLKKYDIDLVILDIMMPGMSGKTVLEKIKKDKKLKKVKVIMLSAMRLEEDEKKEFIKMGADEFLSKPISISILEKIVKKTLAKK
ncbi:DNA-binding response regulator [Candidatus Woesearchaeota archaeon]|nr:MAG: DNA-binding response regulator [Candidatus Woesearchaeota archaeon]